ncbi:MAG: helix-turn-helix transcriptional regulator [Clostridiaceae bacterium]|nr:helix-turn-helix transcriptional regulator [Clostridiaceae bacterium]
MNIGERIKKLRKEKGLSVDYIAEKLGKNRATIYRYESNDIENLPYPILVPLAKILGTTPMYLMGCEIEDIKVTKDEKELLNNYNKLNDLGKQEANKRVAELTEINRYLKDNEVSATVDSSMPIAAHDDGLTDAEKDLMQKRIEEYEKNK